MPIDTLLALAALAIAASWTPGPNNLMLAGSGANFGYRRTLPHMFGVALGFPVMLVAVGMGLGGILLADPTLRGAMRWAGAALLLWFAWRIATAGRAGARRRSRPLSFGEAASFQWINPKAWAIAFATASQFVSAESPLRDSLIAAAVFTATGFGSSTVWTLFGVGIARFLSDPLRLRAFNIGMGLMLAGFVVYMLRDAV